VATRTAGRQLETNSDTDGLLHTAGLVAGMWVPGGSSELLHAAHGAVHMGSAQPSQRVARQPCVLQLMHAWHAARLGLFKYVR
jgi:hypothetical protein